MRARALRKSHSASPSKQPEVESRKGSSAPSVAVEFDADVTGRREHGTHERHALLAKVAHELRTPLNAIVGFTKLLHTGKAGPLSATQAEYLGDVLQSSNHLLKLMNDVLELAKLELGGVSPEPEVLDPASILREVCDTLAGVAVAKQLRIRIEPADDLGELRGDPRLLRQVIVHLLTNAIHFTPDEGLIALRVYPEDAEHFRIEIEDSGPGVAPEQLARLFEPFSKLERRRRQPGSGLGLALAKRLTEALGGSLAAENALGKGTLFVVRLPSRGPSAPRRRHARESRGSP
jgi:signal transduction histidine kinase